MLVKYISSLTYHNRRFRVYCIRKYLNGEEYLFNLFWWLRNSGLMICLQAERNKNSFKICYFSTLRNKITKPTTFVISSRFVLKKDEDAVMFNYPYY